MLCCNLFVSHSSSSHESLEGFYDFSLFFRTFSFASFKFFVAAVNWLNWIVCRMMWLTWDDNWKHNVLSDHRITFFFSSSAFPSFSLHLTFFQQSEEMKSVKQEIQISHWNEMMSWVKLFLPISCKIINFEEEIFLTDFVTENGFKLVCHEPQRDQHKLGSSRSRLSLDSQTVHGSLFDFLSTLPSQRRNVRSYGVNQLAHPCFQPRTNEDLTSNHQINRNNW